MITAKMEIRRNNVSRRIRGVKAASASATWMAAQVGLREAQRRVRVGKTHEVHDSLLIEGHEGEDTVTFGSHGAHGGRPVPTWLETGTHRQKAQPFLRPAAALARRTLKAQAEAKIRADAESDG